MGLWHILFMATERTPEAIAHFRAELARIEAHMTATMQHRTSTRTVTILRMRTLWPDFPAAFWVAMSRLGLADLRAVSNALQAQYDAGLARGREIER